jgi:chemotaxis protein CheD
MRGFIPDFEPDEDRTLRVYLLPGTIHCTPEPALVTTVLGSCVAVCLHDQATGFSGMNHFMLPISEGDETSLRYGDYAIECLVEAMCDICGRGARLEAKVFGGSEMFPTKFQGTSVGVRNISMAVDRLALHGVPIVAKATGGRGGLHLQLDTLTGSVLARRINNVG